MKYILHSCQLLVFLIYYINALDVPMVPLKNTAVSGVKMPAMGLGCGGYGAKEWVGYGGYPECWAETFGCGEYTERAVTEWLQVGGRRLDSANMYNNEKSIGKALKKSSVPRSELFILSKVGPVNPLGFNETLHQFELIKENLQVDYVDLLLIHWPSVQNATLPSKDPHCMPKSPLFNETECRLDTWRAMLQIFKSGGAKAIGVSNFEIIHLQEFIDAGLPLPSVDQCHFNPYGGAAQMKLVNFCKAHDIVYVGYSPLGIPDWHKFPGPHMSTTPLLDPTVLSIAKAHEKSPAQVILAWLWSLGIPTNPRSMNSSHMTENLNIYDISITKEESDKLLGLHQDTCAEDPGYYECAWI